MYERAPGIMWGVWCIQQVVYSMQQLVYIMQCVCASDGVGVWCAQQVVYIMQCVCVRTLDSVCVGCGAYTRWSLPYRLCVQQGGVQQAA